MTAVAALVAGALVVGVTGRAAARPAVEGLRIGVHSETGVTRVVLDLSETVSYRVFTLAAPYRVVVDLPEVTWKLPPPPARGLVGRLRYGLFQTGTSRLVLDLAQPARVQRSFVLPPSADFGPRLVVDLEAVSAEAFRRQGQPTPSLTAPPPAPAKPGGKPLVVVDPGHGGVDPGAIGRSGVYEKAITLATARELKRQLEKSGRYRVLLTRTRDVFVPLARRVDIARRAGAALFISLHADTIANARVRGASVYTLSEKRSDDEAAALAAKENKADLIAGVDLADSALGDDVTSILIDLAQRETMNLSARFARHLVAELGTATRLLGKTHRFAGFRVLTAPDVPSVLIELGYLSNRRDERMLRDRSQQVRMMKAVTRAVDRFFRDVREANRT